jgi:hypothetical protein
LAGIFGDGPLRRLLDRSAQLTRFGRTKHSRSKARLAIIDIQATAGINNHATPLFIYRRNDVAGQTMKSMERTRMIVANI